MTSPALPLRPHVPAPNHRPGYASDFAYMQFCPAGALPRPASDTPEAALREFPYGLIRVLDEHGKAIGEWAPTLSAATLHKGLRAMMLTRAFDERMQRAQRQGKTSFYIKSTGEERSEEHTSELQSLMRISYAVFCLKKTQT